MYEKLVLDGLASGHSTSRGSGVAFPGLENEITPG